MRQCFKHYVKIIGFIKSHTDIRQNKLGKHFILNVLLPMKWMLGLVYVTHSPVLSSLIIFCFPIFLVFVRIRVLGGRNALKKCFSTIKFMFSYKKQLSSLFGWDFLCGSRLPMLVLSTWWKQGEFQHFLPSTTVLKELAFFRKMVNKKH